MKVTDEMYHLASDVFADAGSLQDALQAVLADVPEPDETEARIAELESQLAFERERYELLAMDYAGADADRKAQPPAPDPSNRVRIAELESAVQHVDKVVEQLTAERDAALERAEKAERDANWALEHADLTLPRQR